MKLPSLLILNAAQDAGLMRGALSKHKLGQEGVGSEDSEKNLLLSFFVNSSLGFLHVLLQK